MNGTEEIVDATNAEGIYTVAAEWNRGTPLTGYTFDLYSLVDSDGNEYGLVEGTTDQFDLSSISTDTTLYAKYSTGIIVGDLNNDGFVNKTDSGFINTYYNSQYKVKPQNVAKNVYEGSTLIVGDLNSDGFVNKTDSGFINTYYNSQYKVKPQNVAKLLYLLNADTVSEILSAE